MLSAVRTGKGRSWIHIEDYRPGRGPPGGPTPNSRSGQFTVGRITCSAWTTLIRPLTTSGCARQCRWHLNLEEINSAYFGGYCRYDTSGAVEPVNDRACSFQFEEWPEDVRKVFDYDPKGAEALLDEAGYPRGADGTRFTVEFMHLNRYSTSWPELVGSYWKKIGVDIEIEVLPINPWVARSKSEGFPNKEFVRSRKVVSQCHT